MDTARMRSTLIHHPKTRASYRDGSLWTAETGAEFVITGTSTELLFTALETLTDNGPLSMRLATIENEYCAIISDPSGTHVSVSTDRAVNSTIVGATINNLQSNQGVQGVFNTPIHFGKK